MKYDSCKRIKYFFAITKIVLMLALVMAGTCLISNGEVMPSTLYKAEQKMILNNNNTMSSQAELDTYNVIWSKIGRDSADSMPLGNGDTGINLWVDGDIVFYIGKTDSWDSGMNLLKLGEVRIHLSPNPFISKRGKATFTQELSLKSGSIYIKSTQKDVGVKIWVDGNNNVIRAEAVGKEDFSMTVSLRTWRNESLRIVDTEPKSGEYSSEYSPAPFKEYPDVVLNRQMDKVVWFHRNEQSIYPDSLKLQGFYGFINKEPDPLLGRTFGGMIRGDGLANVAPNVLKSLTPTKSCTVSIYTHTATTSSGDMWSRELEKKSEEIEKISIFEAWGIHVSWWAAFWQRSYINISLPNNSKLLKTISQNYALQRFMNACGGRGKYPIKFNGSIFNMDTYEMVPTTDSSMPLKAGRVFRGPDYRRWGGPYWFQNTRLIYWPMLASGDFDLMQPLFKMYFDAIPLARYRTETYYNHQGAFFPETMLFWGTWANGDFGWDRNGSTTFTAQNPFVRHNFVGGLELLAMMLEYYEFVGDYSFATETMLPFAEQILTFYDRHYRNDKNGRLVIEPAQSLETWQNVVNPTPEVAGLTAVTSRLLNLPKRTKEKGNELLWKSLKNKLPNIPMEGSFNKVLLPAEKLIESEPKNTENPELIRDISLQALWCCQSGA